jgi:hypothetical protein
MPGRRRVDDDLVIGPVGPGGREAAQLEEADQLVDAGKREAEERVDVVVVEVGPAPDDPPQRLPALLDPPRERGVGVELDEREILRGPRDERVAQRMRGIGRDDEDAAAGGGEGGGRGGRTGGLADAALPREEVEGRLSDRFRRRPPSTCSLRCR